MTKLRICKNGDHFVGFECFGHSGYAEQGEDIVCAAVSTAVQMTVAYLVKYFADKVEAVFDSDSACIKLRCNEIFTEADRQISVLVDFANDVREQYCNYFTFEFFGGVTNV